MSSDASQRCGAKTESKHGAIMDQNIPIAFHVCEYGSLPGRSTNAKLSTSRFIDYDAALSASKKATFLLAQCPVKLSDLRSGSDNVV